MLMKQPMLFHLLISRFNQQQIAMIGILTAWLVTLFFLNCRFSFLPQDHGRAFAVNGEKSKGKLRGVGLVIAACYVAVSLFILPVSREYVIFCILFLAVMLSGYLDDASQTPWSDYKKGLIDFIICVVYMASYVKYNPTVFIFFHNTIELNPVLYGILGIVLIWVSINVTNCSDGVDGLCATLSIITVFSFCCIFTESLGPFATYSYILIGCILAYLRFNSSPSTMLMGDAGSRALGFFIAVTAMKSGHPFCFIPLALVLILDGGLGLVKIFLLRFFHIHFLTHTRTPIHDEMRKNRAWSDTQVVFRFAILQAMLSIITYLIVI